MFVMMFQTTTNKQTKTNSYVGQRIELSRLTRSTNACGNAADMRGTMFLKKTLKKFELVVVKILNQEQRRLQTMANSVAVKKKEECIISKNINKKQY